MFVRKLFLLLMFFSVSAYAQFLPQTEPTQPTVINPHPKPSPDYSMCEAAYTACVIPSDSLQSSVFILSNYCNLDAEAFRFINDFNTCPQYDPEIPPDNPIECLTCSCPADQIRVDGLCVPDLGCNYGIQDFVTGSCYAPTCPYGDGSPASCNLEPSCVQYENAILVPANGSTPARCECPIFTEWDQTSGSCAAPQCGVTEGPLNSIYNNSTHACECSITAFFDEPTNSCVENSCSNPAEVWNSSLHTCVVGSSCPKNYDLNTSTMSCYKITNDAHQCSLLPHPPPSQASDPAVAAAQDIYLHQFYLDTVAACEEGKADPEGSYLSIEKYTHIDQLYYSWHVPQNFCTERGGVWNEYLNTCMNGAVQDSPPTISSSSSRSSSSSSSRLSSSSSSTSTPNQGGGSSSGNGSGGEGGNGGDGDGGSNGGGAGSSISQQSSASSQNISVAASASSISSTASSASNSHAQNSSINSSVSGSSGGGTSSGSGTSSGTGTSSGNGGGGDGGNNGGGTSAGNNSSSGNNSSANSSSGAGECDPESKDYLDCIGKDKKPFSDHTTTASGATTIGEVNHNFLNSITNSPLVSSFNNVSNLIVVPESECPQFSIDLSDTIIGIEISTQLHCDLMLIIAPFLNLVTMIGWSFMAFRIFASA